MYFLFSIWHTAAARNTNTMDFLQNQNNILIEYYEKVVAALHFCKFHFEIIQHSPKYKHGIKCAEYCTELI